MQRTKRERVVYPRSREIRLIGGDKSYKIGFEIQDNPRPPSSKLHSATCTSLLRITHHEPNSARSTAGGSITILADGIAAASAVGHAQREGAIIAVDGEYLFRCLRLLDP